MKCEYVFVSEEASLCPQCGSAGPKFWTYEEYKNAKKNS